MTAAAQAVRAVAAGASRGVVVAVAAEVGWSSTGQRLGAVAGDGGASEAVCGVAGSLRAAGTGAGYSRAELLGAVVEVVGGGFGGRWRCGVRCSGVRFRARS